VGYLLLAPAGAFYFLFQLLPIILAAMLSFFTWNGISLSQLRFAGLSNYAQLAHDPVFIKSLVNTLIIVAVVLVIQGLGGFVLAVGIYAHIPGATFFRRMMFVPVVISPVAVALVGIFVFSPNFGLLDATLRNVGLASLQVPWLGSERFALPAVIVTYIFQNVGLTVLLFLAALQQVEVTLLDAARVDGASPKQMIWDVIVPVIRPVAGIVILLALVSAFRLFDVSYVLTDGGPYYASSTLVLYLYDVGFTQSQVGYADAIGVVLFVIILVVAAVQLRLMRAGSRP
jgi:multiple sugar transport system permease protein